MIRKIIFGEDGVQLPVFSDGNQEISVNMWILIVFFVVFILINVVGAFAVIKGEPAPPQWAKDDHPMMIAREISTPEDTQFTKYFINNWYRWDTGWYLKIASIGYDKDDFSIGFQPFYPIAIRLVRSLLGISYLSSALIISRVSCLIALGIFFRIAYAQFHSWEIAQRSTILMLTFPSSFFLFTGYTEALFLVLVLSSWYYFLQRKWFLAGFLGCLASLTRLQGLILSIPMLWITLSNNYEFNIGDINTKLKTEIKSRWKSISILNPIFAALMPSISVGFYSLYLKISGMNSITHAYSHWGTDVLWPWEGLWKLVERTITENLNFIDYVDLILFIIFFIGIFFSFKKLPMHYSLFNLSMFLLILMVGRKSNFLPGFMRYMLIVFPLFILFGKYVQRKIFYVIVTLSMSINLFLLWLYINWFWIA